MPSRWSCNCSFRNCLYRCRYRTWFRCPARSAWICGTAAFGGASQSIGPDWSAAGSAPNRDSRWNWQVDSGYAESNGRDLRRLNNAFFQDCYAATDGWFPTAHSKVRLWDRDRRRRPPRRYSRGQDFSIRCRGRHAAHWMGQYRPDDDPHTRAGVVEFPESTVASRSPRTADLQRRRFGFQGVVRDLLVQRVAVDSQARRGLGLDPLAGLQHLANQFLLQE